MAGRKPKPTALKELEGNPGKRKLNKKEPMPGKGMPDCPKWLLPDAQEEWKRLRMTLANEKAVYACINYGEAFCPGEIEERSICIDGDIGWILDELK